MRELPIALEPYFRGINTRKLTVIGTLGAHRRRDNTNPFTFAFPCRYGEHAMSSVQMSSEN